MLSKASLWGTQEQLRRVIEWSAANKSDIPCTETGAGSLSFALSSSIDPGHWVETADRLDALHAMLDELSLDELNMSVKTIVAQKRLPGGERMYEPLMLSGIVIAALAKLKAEFEFTFADA